jgi:hypothetical protein
MRWLWLHLPLQAEAVVSGFHVEFKNGSTKQKKQESHSHIEKQESRLHMARAARFSVAQF